MAIGDFLRWEAFYKSIRQMSGTTQDPGLGKMSRGTVHEEVITDEMASLRGARRVQANQLRKHARLGHYCAYKLLPTRHGHSLAIHMKVRVAITSLQGPAHDRSIGSFKKVGVFPFRSAEY